MTYCHVGVIGCRCPQVGVVGAVLPGERDKVLSSSSGAVLPGGPNSSINDPSCQQTRLQRPQLHPRPATFPPAPHTHQQHLPLPLLTQPSMRSPCRTPPPCWAPKPPWAPPYRRDRPLPPQAPPRPPPPCQALPASLQGGEGRGGWPGEVWEVWAGMEGVTGGQAVSERTAASWCWTPR